VEVAGRYQNPPAALQSLLAKLPNWERIDRPYPKECSPHKVSDRLGDDLQELIAAYQAGASTRVLALNYGIGKTSVLRLLRRTGVPLRPRGGYRS